MIFPQGHLSALYRSAQAGWTTKVVIIVKINGHGTYKINQDIQVLQRLYFSFNGQSKPYLQKGVCLCFFDHDSLPWTLLRLIVVTKHTFVLLSRDTSKEMKTQKVGKIGMELSCLIQKIADSIFLLSNSAHTNGTRTTLNSNCSGEKNHQPCV